MLKLKSRTNILSNRQTIRFLSASADAVVPYIVSQPQFHRQTYMNFNNPTKETSINHPLSSPIDPYFFISALLSCKNTLQIKQVHAQVTSNGMLLHNLNVANKLLYLYARHKGLSDAYMLFDRMTEKDQVSWSVMVGGFGKVGDYMRCFGSFREFIRCGLQLDNYMLPVVIRACKDTASLMLGRLVHCVGLKCGLVLDHFVSAALVDMYAKCGMIENATQLFYKMPHKDLVTWTAMISGYAECGNAHQSWVLFDQMREEGILPDKIAMVTVVNACAKLGALNKAKLVHDYICRSGFSLDVILGTSMIDMYAKCGNVESAREIFDKMQKRNVVSWSAMIAAYGYHGQGREALDLFPMMLSSGILPNNITFVSLLHACSHAGLVEEGLQIFSSMQRDYSVAPGVKHCTCVVDLLGRAGKLDEALRFIENINVEKDEGLWSALLGACRIRKRVDLAEMAAKSLLEVQPQNPGHYILLSNIYANAGKWKDVAQIRDLMTKRRLKKIPGYTWIEVDNILYRFGVGDKTHPRSNEIYEMLKSLREKLELSGYVPDTNFVLHDVDEEFKVELLYTHSEKLAIAFALIATPETAPIRMSKNLRFCGDCHAFSKAVSSIMQREIIVRDANRFHHFKEGACSCGDYW